MWKLKDINQYLVESRAFTAKELQKKAQELLKGLGINLPSKKLLDDTVNHIKTIINSERIGVVFESKDSQDDSIFENQYMDMIQEETVLDISRDELDHMVIVEFFNIGRFFKGLFVNPRVKKQIRKLSDELVKIRVEQAKETLDMDDREFKKFHDDGDANRGKDKKVATLDDQAQAIEAKMDLLAKNDERLESYLELQKIDARIRANDIIIKMADDAQKKILSRTSKDLVQQGRKVETELKKRK